MPRKTKDIENVEKDETVKKAKKTATTKKTATAKKQTKTAEKKASVSSKKETKKTTNTKKEKSKKIDKKETTKKKANTTKKTEPKKSKVSKSSTTKAKSTTKSSAKKTTTRTKKTSNPVVEPVEYYDLPYRYNQTVVKLLAQTPNSLFIYWDISDEDRENFKNVYGDKFFEETKPVLIIHNETMNYSFEIDINDFANSWYLHVNDSKCDYKIELGRRPIVYNEKINDNYVYISSSNDMVSPNDKVLFNVNPENIYFKNVKTNSIEQKAISKLSFIPHLERMAKIYNIYDLYKKLYKDENLDDIINPSSGNPSSGSLSSRFM